MEIEESATADARRNRLNTWVAVAVALLATFTGLCKVKDDNMVQTMQQAQADRIDDAHRDALTAAAQSRSPPALDPVARAGAHKRGAGVNVEQPLSEHGNFGLLLRAGWNDGLTDGFATTEVDRLASIATQYRLRRWNARHQDVVGVGLARHWLSADHRAYLAAGGKGFFLGDGALVYAPETTLEGYYRVQLTPRVQLGPDVQLVQRPGNNATRGAARLVAARAHVEY